MKQKADATEYMYAQMPDIDDVEPLSEKDEACIREVRNVLAKHGYLKRLGICLLHDHFEIGDDEVLLETCNVDGKTLTLKPVKKSRLENESVVETSWRLDTGGLGEPITSCRTACLSSPKGHSQSHESLPEV